MAKRIKGMKLAQAMRLRHFIVMPNDDKHRISSVSLIFI
jgi:hypothetical protein